MDNELLHSISAIDREITELERIKSKKEFETELKSLRNNYQCQKSLYENSIKDRDNLTAEINSKSKSLEDKTKELKTIEDKLYSSSNIKTIEALQQSLSKLDLEIKDDEDYLLNVMGENEELIERLKKQAKIINDLGKSYNLRLTEYKKIQQDIDGKIVELKNKRDMLMNEVTEKSKNIYEDIKRKCGYGMSEVKSEICSGCNMDVPIVIINEARHSHELIKCPNCGRLLYIVDL